MRISRIFRITKKLVSARKKNVDDEELRKLTIKNAKNSKIKKNEKYIRTRIFDKEYEIIKKIRTQVEAPVDTIGCGKLADPEFIPISESLCVDENV